MRFLLVELTGIEPVSKNLSKKASPSADGLLNFRSCEPSVRLASRNLLRHDEEGRTPPFTFTANVTPLPTRGSVGSDGCLIRQRKQLFCCQLILKCGFYSGSAPLLASSSSKSLSKPLQPRIKNRDYLFCSLMALLISRSASFLAATARLS